MNQPSPANPPPRIARHGRRNWLWVIVCAHLGLVVILAMIIMNASRRFSLNEEFIFVLLGLASAQSSLLGLWAVLGTECSVRRLTHTLGLVGILTLALMIFYRRIDQPRSFVAIDIGLTALGPYLAFQVLWIARQFSGLRIAATHDAAFTAHAPTAQFSLGQIMLWFVAVTAFLALFRLLIPPPESNPLFPYLLQRSLIVGLWLLCTVIDTLLLTWLCLLDYRTVLARIVGGTLLLLLLGALVFEGKTTYWDSFFTLRGAELALALVTLCALRWAGYRLGRSETKAAEIQAEA